MEETISVSKLLARRKQTRAIADVVRQQVKDYLTVLNPSLRPRATFGEYAQGSAREALKGPEEALRRLQELFAGIVTTKLYSLAPKELTPPLEFPSSNIDLHPFEYTREVSSGSVTKTVLFTSPLKWVLSYQGFPVRRLKEVVADRNRNNAELRQLLVNYLGLHVVISRQPAVVEMLKSLHVELGAEQIPELGNLPVPCVSSAVQTRVPAAEVVIESTELSGSDAFEEIVDLQSIGGLRDPFKERLIELASAHGETATA